MKKILQLIPASLLALSFGAQANIAITIQQMGEDVVLNGSGSIMTDGLNCHPDGASPKAVTKVVAKNDVATLMIQPEPAHVVVGNISDRMVCFLQFAGVDGKPFGTGSEIVLGEALNGHFAFKIQEETLMITLPPDYESGGNLEFSGVLKSTSLQELGFIVGGGYTWTWNTQQAESQPKAASTEFLSMKVLGATPPTAPTSVPALGAFGLIGLAGAIGAAGVAMTRRRKK